MAQKYGPTRGKRSISPIVASPRPRMARIVMNRMRTISGKMLGSHSRAMTSRNSQAAMTTSINRLAVNPSATNPHITPVAPAIYDPAPKR